MPGPGPNIPGITPGARAPKPRQVVKPWIVLPDLPTEAFVKVPLDVTSPFRHYWNAFGQVLPQAISQQRNTRKAMLRLAR